MASRHPDITRTAITRTCAACQGAGEVTVNTASQPFGIPDPQCDVDIECEACDGAGEVTEWVDPLVALRRSRTEHRIPFLNGYRAKRARAMEPVRGLRHAEFLAACSRVQNDARRMRMEIAA